MISRRSFLGSILALSAAPAIVRAESLMRIVPVYATPYDDFTRRMLGEIAAATRVTYEDLAHDYVRCGYSSARVAMLEQIRIEAAFREVFRRECAPGLLARFEALA